MLDGTLSLPVVCPTGPIDDEHGMGAWRHLGRDFIEMPLHGLGIAAGQDEARTDTAPGADGAEDVGRFRALVLGRPGAAAEIGRAHV